MPECLMLAYAERIPSIRAGRKIDAADAASVPHFKTDDARSWYDAMRRVVEVVGHAVETPFTFNGRSIATKALRRRFSKAFASAYVDD